jgi:flagellar biosynthesis protein FlhA
MGGGMSFAGWKMRRRADSKQVQAPALQPKPSKENLDLVLHVEPLTIEVGLGLVSLVDGNRQSPLLQRVSSIRRQLASQLGYVLPIVKVNDNLSLKTHEYLVLMKGAEVARFELMQGHELAIPSGAADPRLEGIQARDPAFGLLAYWIRSERAEQARRSGYTVVDAVSILGTHFAEIVRRHAHELFTRQEAKNFCDRVAKEHPRTVEDLVPKLLSYSVIQKVLQNLLRERVSIRDGVTILEALAEAAGMTKNSVLLTEYVRQSIRRMIVSGHVNSRNELAAFHGAGNRAVHRVRHRPWRAHECPDSPASAVA